MKSLTTAKITLFFASEPSATPADSKTEGVILNAPEMIRDDVKDIKQTPSAVNRQLRARYGEEMPMQERELGSVVTIISVVPSCCSTCCIFKK